MIMDEFTKRPRRLAEVPVLNDLDPTPRQRRRRGQDEDTSQRSDAIGVFARARVREFADQLRPDLIEWPQVVELRRRASEA